MTASDARHVAAMMAASLNAVRTVGLAYRDVGDNVRVFSEPGHPDGWHDVAAIEYDEEKDRWSVVGSENEPQPDGDPLDIPWYPMPEDTIGGWCVMSTPDPPSASKGYYVADFISGPEIAKHVADLHNAQLPTPEVTPLEASVLLGISRPTVIRLCEQGILPYRKVGTSHRRIPRHAVLEYRNKQAPWLDKP